MATDAPALACPHGVVDDICLRCSPIRYLGDVQRLRLQEGDILVIRSKETLSADVTERLRQLAQEEFKPLGVKVMVMDRGLKVGVLSRTL